MASAYPIRWIIPSKWNHSNDDYIIYLQSLAVTFMEIRSPIIICHSHIFGEQHLQYIELPL